MTSSAVTASMCASASDVALFVASFMPFPPWTLDTTHRCAKTRANAGWNFTRNAPASILLCESPLGIDRQFQRSSGNAAPIGLGYVGPASDCR